MRFCSSPLMVILRKLPFYRIITPTILFQSIQIHVCFFSEVRARDDAAYLRVHVFTTYGERGDCVASLHMCLWPARPPCEPQAETLTRWRQAPVPSEALTVFIKPFIQLLVQRERSDLKAIGFARYK